MKNLKIPILASLLVLISILLAACSAQGTPSVVITSQVSTLSTPVIVETRVAETYTDAFSYCADVGTIDAPDARYLGPKTTDEIVKGYLKAAGIEFNSEYSDTYRQMTIWRCMDKKVFACNFGANLPCDSKANTEKTPTQAMADFCKQNPGSDFIPMAVTGHDTIYSFHCVQDAPEILDQIAQVDAAGFLANIWYPLEP